MNNEFSGDVGQVVMGNSKVGPALHNVMNVTVAQSEVDKKEFKPINKFQRSNINAKVKEVRQSTGIDEIELYRHLLAEFGADNLNGVSTDSYKDAMDFLEKFRVIHAGSKAERPEHIDDEATPCMECQVNQNRLKKARIAIIVLCVFIVTCGAGLGWMFLHVEKKEMPDVIAASDEYCHHDGKSFSVGSVVKMPDATFMQCINAPGTSPNYWEAMRPLQSKTTQKHKPIKDEKRDGI